MYLTPNRRLRTIQFLKLDNVVATPHMAAHTNETLSNMAKIVCKNVLMVLNGQKPDNIANPGNMGSEKTSVVIYSH